MAPVQNGLWAWYYKEPKLRSDWKKNVFAN